MIQKVKVAVIVVTYNRADVTNLLFDSLTRAKVNTEFELIVIDNKSKLSEFQRIKRFFKYLVSQGLLTGQVIRLTDNSGFPGGNNRGLSEAIGNPRFTHFCLLNNDTIVTDHWLDELVEVAGENALVGPVSNSVGNEQVVPADYKIAGWNRYTTNNVLDFARSWRENHQPMTFETEMLGFFCVLGSRRVFEEVGMLDESFGVGTFEDDDYCRRCLDAGFKLLIARRVFVHHWGSATFGILASRSRELLTERNRKIYEEKHETKWVSPANTIPLALDQESICAHPNYFEAIKAKYIENIRGQIKWLDERSQVLHSPSFRRLLYIWLATRVSMYRGVWPKPLRLAAQFVVAIVLGGRDERYYARRGAAHVRQRWSHYMQRYLRHLWYRVKLQCLRWLSGGKKQIVVFPIGPFAGRKQRAQHLAQEFAGLGHHVLWVDPESSRWKIGFHHPCLLTCFERVGEGSLTTVQLGKIDFSNFYVTGMAECESERLIHSLRSIANLERAHVVVQSTFWAPLLKTLRRPPGHGKVIYDCMDDHVSFGSATHEVELLEKMLLDGADVVVTTSDHLKKVVEGRVENKKAISLIRNAVQYDHFVRPPAAQIQNGHDQSEKMAARSGALQEGEGDFDGGDGECEPEYDAVVGYFGAIAEWFDDDLLLATARALPKVKFELIGNADLSVLSRSELPPNVALLNEQPYEKLPELTLHWQAGLIPFRLTPLILATNPVKLYEYSALGLPVVSTPIPEVLCSGLKVYCGATSEEFIEALKDALGSDGESERKVRKDFAQKNTWRVRAQSFVQAFVEPVASN